uniref:CID domain-containing protein n=1 Tax=Globisporangium ultimum (strain ATCC 200006 / CBS 805.95 / DAOM BR144) TaxID=431595 RepID=K3WRR8_GLOUD
MGGDGGKAYSPEKLEKLLRRAKVTQQSIQMVSHWMLEHRAAMGDMVELWTRLFRDGDTNYQIVNLYIANDAMQVGARKYGKHVAEVFESKLLEVAEFVMAHCDEKVKRCLMKIVGIWKQRNIINAAVLNALQNVCAGKPAFEPVVEIDAMTDVRDERAEHEAFLKQLVSDESIERVLEDMPEVLESEMTVATTQRLQNFVSATISADLLSDRMFQLESSLNNFNQACEAFATKQKSAKAEGGDASYEAVEASRGNIVWELMEQQLFDLDIEKSRDHVQQYRNNLEGQTAKREELLEHLQNLQDADLFTEPLYASSMDTLDDQCHALERLYMVCSEADSIERQREAERQAAYMIANARVEDPFQPQNSYVRSGTSSPGGGASYDYQSYRNSDSSYERGGHERHNSLPILRRHGSAVDSSRSYYGGDSEDRRYGGGGSAQSKRPKLQHTHSLDSYGDRSRWSMESEPRQHSGDSYRSSSYHQDHGRRYESSRYSPPRHERSRSSKWDRAPDDHYDDRRGGGRRW